MNAIEIEELDEAGNLASTYVHTREKSGARIDVIVCRSIF